MLWYIYVCFQHICSSSPRHSPTSFHTVQHPSPKSTFQSRFLCHLFSCAFKVFLLALITLITLITMPEKTEIHYITLNGQPPNGGVPSGRKLFSVAINPGLVGAGHGHPPPYDNAPNDGKTSQRADIPQPLSFDTGDTASNIGHPAYPTQHSGPPVPGPPARQSSAPTAPPSNRSRYEPPGQVRLLQPIFSLFKQIGSTETLSRCSHAPPERISADLEKYNSTSTATWYAETAILTSTPASTPRSTSSVTANVLATPHTATTRTLSITQRTGSRLR